MFSVRPPLSVRVSLLRARLFLGISILLVIWLWHTPFILPVKTFVVFLHESSHALMAIVTGGTVQSMTLDELENGSCTTKGGNPFLIISAGYLGSIVWGVLLIVLACRTDADRLLAFAAAAAIIAVTFFYVENTFGQRFGYAAGAVGVVAALALPGIVCEAMLILLGVTSCLYAFLDIVLDVFYPHKGALSDADLLSQFTGVPTITWGALWLLLSGWAVVWALDVSVSSDESEDEEIEES